MECKFCQKVFHKGEHLRRHERSHTGFRPFVCKECKRAFSRQDSLIRHEKLHTRRETAQNASPAIAWESEGAACTSPSFPNAGDHDAVPSASSAAQDQNLAEGLFSADTGLPQTSSAAELDFELMWPDSVDLFQTIMSQDAVNQWQIPLGTLPFSSELPHMGNAAYETPSSLDDRVSSIGAIPSGANHQAVHDVSKMVANLSSSVTAAVESTSINSVFLDECLHMFFVRFITIFPVLHRGTFVFKECTHPLLLNAIAIGSLYLGPKAAIVKGEVLWRLAHTAVATSWQNLITHRGPYDACEGVQLVITALLSQVYGALSTNRAIRTTSQAFRALGFFWARHCGMIDSESFSIDSLPSPHASAAEKEHCWKTWAASEIQRRALLAHYILDGLIAQMSAVPTSARHGANPMGLPSNEAAFEAATAEEWLSAMQSERVPQSSFRNIIRLLFSTTADLNSLNHTFSAFSLTVLLEALQSFVCDWDEIDILPVVGAPYRAEVRRALARIYEHIASNDRLSPESRLETLLRWHAICLDAVTDSSLLCRYVCSRYNIAQQIWPKSKKRKPELDLISWAATEDARRALLHAVAIQDIIEQLPRGRAHAIHMPSALFAAATVYSVFSLADIVTVKLISPVDWDVVVLHKNEHPQSALDEFPSTMTSRNTSNYIRGENLSGFGTTCTTRNLVYELNSMQKLFRCLSTQWGIASDMEKVVDQWVTLCH